MNHFRSADGLIRLAAYAFPFAFLLVFFITPIIGGLLSSLNAPEFDLESYRYIFQRNVYISVYLRTIQISFTVMILCVLLGYTCAYFLWTLSGTLRAIGLTLVVVPFMLSALVRNYTWMLILQDTGILNQLLIGSGLIEQPLRMVYNQFGVLVAMVNMLVPYVVFPVLSALMAMPKDLGIASQSLGGGSVRTFFQVTLPLTAAGTGAGALLVFILSMGFYITPAMLGGNRELMLSNLIEYNVRQELNWPLAFSLANTLLAITVLMYFIYKFINVSERRAEWR